MTRLAWVASAALSTAAGVAGSAALVAQAAPAPAPATSPSRLLPLSDADMGTSTGTGCQFTFGQGNSTFVFMIGRDLLIRTADGLEKCPVSQAEFDGFGADDRTAIACGGRGLSLRKVGRSESNPRTDSSGGGAVLTMVEGARSRAVRGDWGTAC